MVYSAKSKGGTRWEREMSVRRRRRQQQLQGGVQLQSSGRARAERTENIDPMSVTLETMRLSGWLNADAP